MAETVSVEPTARQRKLDVARVDPSVFIEIVCGYRQQDLQREIQEFLSEHDSAAVALPRGHTKTDQIAVCRTAWEIGRNPDVRIKVFKNSDDEARKAVDATRRIIEGDRYKEVFGNLVDSEHWSGRSFRVKRQREAEKEPTYQSYGIMGSYTGGRGDIIICDDICDMKNSVQRPADREKIKELWRNSIVPMATKNSKHWYPYTPYHVADCTSLFEKQMPLFRRPVINFESPWPDEFPPERLREIKERIGTHAYARAYELKRVSDADLLVRAHWLDNAFYLDSIPKGVRGRKIASVDFAFTKKRAGGVGKQSNDPDYSACTTAIVDPTGNCYIDQIYRDQTTYPDFKEHLIDMCQDCEIVLAEDVAAQRALIQDLNMTTPLNVRGVSPNEQGTQMLDKRARLAMVTPMIEAGKLHLKAHKHQGEFVCADEHKPLYDELTTFPICEHDDVLDTVTQLLREVKRRYVVSTKEKKPPQSLFARSERLDRYWK